MKLNRVAAAMVAAGFFQAGIANADDERELATMKVTADQDKPVQQRTELGRLTEYTPVSGATVTEEQIEHLQIVNNLLELGKRVPGISMIRNMRIPDGGKQYTENRIDGMRAVNVNTSVFDEIDMAGIERIDVTTGPASALYGSGAFGGTISLFNRQPPRQFEAKASQELGSWGFQRTQGFAGTSVLDGRVGFLVTGSTMENGGWRRNTAPSDKDAAEERKDGIALRTLIRPTDSTKVSLGYSELRYNYRWAGPIPLTAAAAAKLKNVSVNGTNLRSVYHENDWRDVVPGTYGRSIEQYDTSSIRLQQLVGEKGEFTLAHASIRNDSVAFGVAGSGGANNVICDNVTVSCVATNGSATKTNTLRVADSTTKTTLAMFRQDFDFAKTTAYLGMEVIDITTDTVPYNNVFTALQAQGGAWAIGSVNTSASARNSKEITTETTPFVHVEFSPVDRLRLHLGERFGKMEYDIDDRTAANKDYKFARKGDVLRLGATFEMARDHLVWANWGETFNPQSASSTLSKYSVPTAGNEIGRKLSPERGLTKEIGLRGLFQNAGLRYDVTLFDAGTDGFIVTRDCSTAEAAEYNGGLACTISDNAGKIATRGIESMVSWAVTPWLDVGATFTRSKVWFADYVTKTFDFTGNSYQSAPRNRLNLRLGVKPAPGWLVELEGDHISRYYVDNTNNNGTYKRPDLFSLRASYRSKSWSYWLHVINLTDRKYATRVQLSTIAGQQNTLAAQAGQGNAGSYAPLTVRAGLSYQF